jgi:pantoate kinase
VPGASVRRASAFAPAHVSGIVVPRLEARDPRARGSLGAGLVLSVGVTASARWEEASRPSVRVTAKGRPRLDISEAVARRLAARRPGRLTVRLEHGVPIGQGFGTSAAGALVTALAVAAALELPPSRAVEVAHLADLFGGGGLGGVAAILGGGLEVRTVPGIPPFGRVVHRRLDRTVVVGTVGPPLRTSTVLRDPARRRRFEEGAPLFEALAARPGWEEFWTASEQFTETVRLTPARLSAVLRGLRRRGARAAQAMFGRSFFAALPTGTGGPAARRWLQSQGVAYQEVALARRGAHLLPRERG